MVDHELRSLPDQHVYQHFNLIGPEKHEGAFSTLSLKDN